MGLDMYLKASRYFGGWQQSTEQDKLAFRALAVSSGLNVEDITQGAPSLTVECNVMYWRKANAIHAWFVQNVQGGKDECQRSDVSRQELETLAGLCEEILADNTKAEKMPPCEGFFFGSTEIDAYYFDDLLDTASGIRALLANPRLKDWDFTYQASW